MTSVSSALNHDNRPSGTRSPVFSPDDRRPTDVKIAILIPCRNEAITVQAVVRSFQEQLPHAEIFVFDNNSTDLTAERARKAGATVIAEPRPGKGYVVQRMFEYVEADVYVMVDGDETYPAKAVHALIEPILRGEADMVVGSRLHSGSSSEFRSLNRVGNRLFLRVVNLIFRANISDMLSGYRAFTRTFVKRLPLLSGGFEIETELTIKALEGGFRVAEVPVDLISRPEGSHSKIRVGSDGVRILSTILRLFRDYKPLTFFGGLGLFAILFGLVPGLVVIEEYARTGFVARLPSAVLATGLEIVGMLLISIGLILHTIVARSQELDVRMRLLANEIASAARGRSIQEPAE